jgi:hypothetical protein
MGPMHGRFLLLALALAIALGLPACGGKSGDTCDDGSCTCEAGETDCGGTCTDTLSDPAHCGGCGTACAAGEACTDGACAVPCDASKLMAPIADPWGTRWDGLERTAATLDAANVECTAFGGRLPTATEMYRVSASRSGAVGQSFHTNFLWSRTPNDRLNQVTTRLSDGTTSAASAAAPSAVPYRCVCPASPPPAFTGARCNGPAGSECFRWGPYHIDKADRPALRKSAAIQECVNERAHLADLPLLGAAIRAGLPGSNALIGTADGARYDLTTTIRWAGATWEPAGNTDVIAHQTPIPFRCAGPAAPASISATPVPDEFRPPLSRYKGESGDHPASVWAAAHDTCWLRGGHLARSTELAELIGQGLPGGTGQYLWTSDEMGYNGTQFLAAVLRWSGLDRRFPFEYTAGSADQTTTWAYKTDPAHAFRCIYYPIDPMFQPPATCNGGCNVRSAGSPAVTIFFDTTDRPAAAVGAAMADCGATGGYLASERDLTEAIRDGLPNGSGAYLNTWDLGLGTNPTNLVTLVLWSGVNKAFDDQYPTFMTWSDPAAMRPYRCMWTNELR